MSREALWTALAEATDAVKAAVEEYRRAPTPPARAARDAVCCEYVKRLSPVIGQVEAFAFEASLRAYQDVVDRVEQLHATFSADRERWRVMGSLCKRTFKTPDGKVQLPRYLPLFLVPAVYAPFVGEREGTS